MRKRRRRKRRTEMAWKSTDPSRLSWRSRPQKATDCNRKLTNHWPVGAICGQVIECEKRWTELPVSKGRWSTDSSRELDNGSKTAVYCSPAADSETKYAALNLLIYLTHGAHRAYAVVSLPIMPVQLTWWIRTTRDTVSKKSRRHNRKNVLSFLAIRFFFFFLSLWLNIKADVSYQTFLESGLWGKKRKKRLSHGWPLCSKVSKSSIF